MPFAHKYPQSINDPPPCFKVATVLFSGHNHQCHAWRQVSCIFRENSTVATLKYGGGSLMLWGYLGANGIGKPSEH